MKHVLGSSSTTKVTAVQQQDIQPNAVDVRLDRVFKINDDVFEITNESKKHRTTTELFPDEEGFFNLTLGQYDVIMENTVQVGEGEAGWVVIRSTLLRNGLLLNSGIFDAGFFGTIGGVMHVTVGPARIKKGTRIGQYISFAAESLHTYSGDYGLNADGTSKAMEAAKYA